MKKVLTITTLLFAACMNVNAQDVKPDSVAVSQIAEFRQARAELIQKYKLGEGDVIRINSLIAKLIQANPGDKEAAKLDLMSAIEARKAAVKVK